jgi:hypothetical protein
MGLSFLIVAKVENIAADKPPCGSFRGGGDGELMDYYLDLVRISQQRERKT